MVSGFSYFKVTGNCKRLGLEVIKVVCHLLSLPRTKERGRAKVDKMWKILDGENSGKT